MGNLVGTLKQACRPKLGKRTPQIPHLWLGGNIAAQVGWGFLYTLVTCVDKNPRLIGEFRNVRIG